MFSRRPEPFSARSRFPSDKANRSETLRRLWPAARCGHCRFGEQNSTAIARWLQQLVRRAITLTYPPPQSACQPAASRRGHSGWPLQNACVISGRDSEKCSGIFSSAANWYPDFSNRAWNKARASPRIVGQWAFCGRCQRRDLLLSNRAQPVPVCTRSSQPAAAPSARFSHRSRGR